MDKTLAGKMVKVLKDLIGHHRRLLDLVRSEHAAIVDANARAVQEATLAKEAILESIRGSDRERAKLIGELAAVWRENPGELGIRALILRVQGFDVKLAEQLRAAEQTLVVMVKHISEQNARNGRLLEAALEHIAEMKRNALAAGAGPAQTYSSTGARQTGQGGARLLSTQA